MPAIYPLKTPLLRFSLIAVFCSVNILGVFYFWRFYEINGYLPAPFLFDKSDSFMDLFNPMYWASDDGRYTEWLSTYPPMTFVYLKALRHLFLDGVSAAPELLRIDGRVLVFAYAVISAFLFFASQLMAQWRKFSTVERVLLAVGTITSSPFVFALERANLILLCPLFLSIVFSRSGFYRSVSIAILINIKPYFALLMLLYFVRKDRREFAVCFVASGFLFCVFGMLLDDSFLLMLRNILSFSQSSSVFSPREVLALPSSISAFTYVLGVDSVSQYAAMFFPLLLVNNAGFAVETIKWAGLLSSLGIIIVHGKFLRDSEILAVIVLMVTNLGVWVGGYSLLFTVFALPVFADLRYSNYYFMAVFLLLAPLDYFEIVNAIGGIQYSYLSDTYVNVRWVLGLGAVIRPLVNYVLFALLLVELEKTVRRSRGLVSY